jgi:CubicO group peptidase (beta-lactamase class C family)
MLSASPKTPAADLKYAIPATTKDGWQTASLSDEHLDAERIQTLLDRLADNTYKNITSVVIVKDGKLVVEEYFPRLDVVGDERGRALKRVSPQQLYSVTKSVTSILIGIAIDRGLIRGVDEKISSFFPEYADIFSSKDKAELQLKDFLNMSSGLSWDEWTYPYSDTRNDSLKSLMGPDLIRYVLERPVVAPPGEKFAYNTGISIVLGEIIRRASGLSADKFAERYLFEPLGITDYYWAKLPGETVETGGGLFLRPRDMAKIGQLFLNGGRWQEKQIVSENWVKESTVNHAGTMKNPAWLVAADGYGYQWWLGSLNAASNDIRFYAARGRAGQYVLVFPSLQMVAVFTGLNDNKLMNQPLDMLQRYILPAVIAQKPKP